MSEAELGAGNSLVVLSWREAWVCGALAVCAALACVLAGSLLKAVVRGDTAEGGRMGCPGVRGAVQDLEETHSV